MPATWGKNTLTNQALTMMNQALGISAITFTKAVTITDDITGDSVSQLQALTSVNYKQSRTPKAIATQDNKSRLGVTIDNSDVNEDYIYYGVGIYAKQNSTNQEVLFSVIPLTAGATMIAKENNATTASIYLDLYTDIVRGTQVTIMVSNSGTLSREDVQQMISQSIGNALNYPNETASKGTDFNTILDISITRIIKDTTVVNAPSGFSGTGYLTTIGSGDKTVPIMQTLDDTINNIRSTRYFNSTTNVWSEWNAYAKTVDVNQQLDKKVVDNKDGTEQLNGVKVQPFNKLSDTIGGRNLIVAKTIENNTTLDGKGVSFGYLTGFTTDYIPVVANQKYTVTIYDTISSCVSRCAYYDSSKNFISREMDRNISTSSSEVIVIPSGASYIKFSPDTPDKSGKYEDNYKLEQGSIATDWTPAPEDKVNVSDMRKPASDVAGIEEVNAKQDKIGYTPADDSKVAHLSGANNFDTVPTVNNNPLLLASSLPSDLARTGQAQTFTAAQTFSIAPVINDASKDKGDNQAATMADLKSVENLAWHIMSGSSEFFKSYNCWYKINKNQKRLEITVLGVTNDYSESVIGSKTILDLSSIITSILRINGTLIMLSHNGNNKSGLDTNKAKLMINSSATTEGNEGAQINLGGLDEMQNFGQPAYVYYDDLQNAYK